MALSVCSLKLARLWREPPREAVNAEHYQAWGAWSGEANLLGSTLRDPLDVFERARVGLPAICLVGLWPMMICLCDLCASSESAAVDERA